MAQGVSQPISQSVDVKVRRNLIGQRFGKLTVVGPATKRGRLTYYECQCDCGNTKSVKGTHLTGNLIRSCGCLRRRTKYGYKVQDAPTYQTWLMIKQRCLNPKSSSYRKYGGRGITVCERWKDSYDNFIKDMGPRPTPHHSVDRIDNDGPYSPDNCRWATIYTQARNKRTNNVLEWRGKTQCVAQWAEEIGVKANTLVCRIRNGWSVEDVLGKPIAFRSPRRNPS